MINMMLNCQLHFEGQPIGVYFAIITTHTHHGFTIPCVEVWLGTFMPIYNFHVIFQEVPTNHMMTLAVENITSMPNLTYTHWLKETKLFIIFNVIPPPAFWGGGNGHQHNCHHCTNHLLQKGGSAYTRDFQQLGPLTCIDISWETFQKLANIEGHQILTSWDLDTVNESQDFFATQSGQC